VVVEVDSHEVAQVVVVVAAKVAPSPLAAEERQHLAAAVAVAERRVRLVAGQALGQSRAVVSSSA